MLTTNSIAPEFELKDQNGEIHKLNDYRGKFVLIYFYPKDGTPGCTKEACSLRDNYASFEKINVKVIGINSDSVASHKKFAEKYNLPFTLLSDETKEISKAYDSKGLLMTKRNSYLIDPLGKIARAYPNVDPTTHAAKILADLQKLI